jgi:hypothetical protein
MNALQPTPGAWSTDPTGNNVFTPGKVDVNAAIPAILGTQAKMGINDLHPGEWANFIDAQYGGPGAAGDETARRGMVAAGHTPGKEFALDQQRADDIANRDNAAAYLRAVDVAGVNHASDIPIANIQREGAYERTGAQQAGAYSRAMLAGDNAMAREKFKADHPKAGHVQPVDPKRLQSIEKMALRSVPGMLDATGGIDPDIATQLGPEILDAEDAAAADYQDTKNPAHAARAYLDALHFNPTTDKVTPRNNHWIGADEPAHLSRSAVDVPPAAAPAQPAAINYGAVPPDPAARVKGQVYNTPKGPLIWTGTGWVPPDG